MSRNLFEVKTSQADGELFETLLQTPNIHIEKITSYGETSDEWYEQERDEWVALIEGEGTLLFEEENREIRLTKGEYIHIPRMKKHKVTYTSSPAIWLAIHFE